MCNETLNATMKSVHKTEHAYAPTVIGLHDA